MKKRKILAALLAVACAASLAVPASATSIDDLDISDEAKTALNDAATAGGSLVEDAGTVGDVVIDAEVQKPTIAVVLPKKVDVFVNPYRAEVATHYTDPTDKTTADKWSIDTVVSPEMTVANGSNCAIKVNVKGQFVTYKYAATLSGSATTIAETAADWDNNTIGTTVTGWSTLYGNIDTTELYKVDNLYYVKANTGTTDSPVYEYRAANVKYTAGNATKKTNNSYVISGYAPTTIKVAAAAVKEDTDKSNSIFMYVEGTDTAGVYPAAYTKAVAGVDAKGVVKVGGQYALTAKEGSGAVLYLGGNGTTGYMRVTGSASTAPTTSWTEVEESEKFETPFVFVVDPVANAAENPEFATIDATNLKTAFKSGTFAYELKDVSLAAAPATVVLNVTAGAGVTVSGTGTVAATSTNTPSTTGAKIAHSSNKITITLPTSGSKANDILTYSITVTSKHGKTNTYTFKVKFVA